MCLRRMTLVAQWAVKARRSSRSVSTVNDTAYFNLPPSFVFPPLSDSFSPSVSPHTQPIYFPCVAQHRNRCRADPCCPFFSSKFLTITPSLTRDKSNGPTCLLWLCAAQADRWASQLIPFIFLAGAVGCLLLMLAPDSWFPAGEIKAVPRRGDCPSIAACSK